MLARPPPQSVTKSPVQVPSATRRNPPGVEHFDEPRPSLTSPWSAKAAQHPVTISRTLPTSSASLLMCNGDESPVPTTPLQSPVELVERHGFDQRHQLREALGEQREHVLANGAWVASNSSNTASAGPQPRILLYDRPCRIIATADQANRQSGRSSRRPRRDKAAAPRPSLLFGDADRPSSTNGN